MFYRRKNQLLLFLSLSLCSCSFHAKPTQILTAPSSVESLVKPRSGWSKVVFYSHDDVVSAGTTPKVHLRKRNERWTPIFGSLDFAVFEVRPGTAVFQSARSKQNRVISKVVGKASSTLITPAMGTLLTMGSDINQHAVNDLRAGETRYYYLLPGLNKPRLMAVGEEKAIGELRFRKKIEATLDMDAS